jgi:hypothetical protein
LRLAPLQSMYPAGRQGRPAGGLLFNYAGIHYQANWNSGNRWSPSALRGAVLNLLQRLVATVLLLAVGGPLLALQQREIANRESKLKTEAQSAQQRADDQLSVADRHREIATQEMDRAQRQQKIGMQEKKRAKCNLAAGQLALANSALHNNHTAEALNWMLHAYLNSPQNDPMRGGPGTLSGRMSTK